MMKANKESFGITGIPSYRFDNADVIVSFGADFLTNWLSPIEFAKQWPKSTLFTIIQNTGKDIADLGVYEEAETLLLPNRVFEVMSVSHTSNINICNRFIDFQCFRYPSRSFISNPIH